uniref:MIF4G domain-containing protein n=1 Tax=Piliocolobus tephrosceles TaxID=591936 RepID=A0A8C9GIY8_9PRIM
MFLNITYFCLLKLDNNCINKDMKSVINTNTVHNVVTSTVSSTATTTASASTHEKLDPFSFINHSDASKNIKKCLLLNTVITYDYLFTNTNTIFIEDESNAVDGTSTNILVEESAQDVKEETKLNNVIKNETTVSKSETVTAQTLTYDNVLSSTLPYIRDSSYIKHIKNLKKYILSYFRAFYNNNMYNLLVYFYAEHVMNEYNMNNKTSYIKEEYNFYKLYEKSKRFCLFFDLNKYSLDKIQMKGMDILGLKEESYQHIKRFDNLKKNKNDHLKNNEILLTGEYDCIWENEIEKKFYTVFPDFSHIKTTLKDDDASDDVIDYDINVSSVGIDDVESDGLYVNSDDALINSNKINEKLDMKTTKQLKDQSVENNNSQKSGNDKLKKLYKLKLESGVGSGVNNSSKGADNSNKGADNSNKGVDNSNKGVDNSNKGRDQSEEKDDNNTHNKGQKAKEFKTYLTKLIKMKSEEEIKDNVTQFLLNYNTKKKRKLIAYTIIQLNSIYINHIPFYCRYVAIINKFAKDMCVVMIEEIKKIIEKFIKEKYICQNKKNKCISYICELAKFKLLELNYLLNLLTILIDNFTHDHAELCCYILDHCSMLLLNNSKTHIRFLNLFEKLKKVKNSKNLSSHIELLFEDCYIKINNMIKHNYNANGTQTTSITNYTNRTGSNNKNWSIDLLKKKKFLKKLLFENIKNTRTVYICKYIRKFNWNDNFITHCLKKYIFKYLRYMSIYEIEKIASLLFYLAMYKPFFVTQIVDEVYERIITIIEKNDYQQFNLLIQYTHLFSELYVHKLLNSSNVFDLLYFLIGFSDMQHMYNCQHISSTYDLFMLNKMDIEGGADATVVNTAHTNGKTQNKEERATCIKNEKGLFFYYNDNVEKGKQNNNDHHDRVDETNSYKFLFVNKKNFIFRNFINTEENKSYINIKMICIILDTCSKYFNNISILKFKMQKFFLFLIRFLLALKPLPIYIEDITNNLIKQNAKDISKLKTIVEVDTILFRILNCEYLIYLKTLDGSITSKDKNMYDNYNITDRILSFKLIKEDIKSGVVSSSTTNTSSSKDYASQNKHLYQGKERKKVDSHTTGYDQNSTKIQSEYAMTESKTNYNSEHSSFYDSSNRIEPLKRKEAKSGYEYEQNETTDFDIDKEINIIINSSIKENIIMKNKKTKHREIKSAALYSKLLNKTKS